MRKRKIETGKEVFEKKFLDLAKNKIEKSGYDYLEGFYYYLLTNMQYTSAWDYTYKVIKFLEEERIGDPDEIKLNNYVKHLATLKNTSSSNKITSYAALKKFSKYLYANKMSEDDYMSYVERPKPVETPEQVAKREAGIISQAEFNEAIRKAKEDYRPEWERLRNVAILKTFMGTGIRRAALYKMDIEDFDFESGTVMVSEKGEKYRKVYCPPQTMDSIKEWIVYRSKMETKDPNERAVFISSQRNRLGDVQIANIIKKYVGKSPHKLRASYMTELYDKTNDIYLVQQAVGHSSPSTTQLYVRGKKEESAQKAANIMKSIMK